MTADLPEIQVADVAAQFTVCVRTYASPQSSENALKCDGPDLLQVIKLHCYHVPSIDHKVICHLYILAYQHCHRQKITKYLSVHQNDLACSRMAVYNGN